MVTMAEKVGFSYECDAHAGEATWVVVDRQEAGKEKLFARSISLH
jgi:hypothetical protein